MSIEGMFNNNFTPQTVVRTADNTGGFTETWTDGTAFRGRMRPLSAQERLSADRVTAWATHRLYCSVDVTIDETYRISFNSRTFEVKGVMKPSEQDDGPAHLEIDLLEIT